jgi:hypothetical protein
LRTAALGFTFEAWLTVGVGVGFATTRLVTARVGTARLVTARLVAVWVETVCLTTAEVAPLRRTRGCSRAVGFVTAFDSTAAWVARRVAEAAAVADPLDAARLTTDVPVAALEVAPTLAVSAEAGLDDSSRPRAAPTTRRRVRRSQADARDRTVGRTSSVHRIPPRRSNAPVPSSWHRRPPFIVTIVRPQQMVTTL